jgi:hypothetical protein
MMYKKDVFREEEDILITVCEREAFGLSTPNLFQINFLGPYICFLSILSFRVFPVWLLPTSLARAQAPEAASPRTGDSR